jgi:hypothetical protein
MKCEHCGAELFATIAHRFIGGVFTSEPAFECHNCYAIYDLEGNQLEAPINEQSDDEDEESDVTP